MVRAVGAVALKSNANAPMMNGMKSCCVACTSADAMPPTLMAVTVDPPVQVTSAPPVAISLVRGKPERSAPHLIDIVHLELKRGRWWKGGPTPSPRERQSRNLQPLGHLTAKVNQIHFAFLCRVGRGREYLNLWRHVLIEG